MQNGAEEAYHRATFQPFEGFLVERERKAARYWGFMGLGLPIEPGRIR